MLGPLGILPGVKRSKKKVFIMSAISFFVHFAYYIVYFLFEVSDAEYETQKNHDREL